MVDKLKYIADLLEDGEGPDIEDLLSEPSFWLDAAERQQLAIIVHWARLPTDGVTTRGGNDGR